MTTLKRKVEPFTLTRLDTRWVMVPVLIGGIEMMDAEKLEDLIYKILTEEFYLGVAMSSNIARAIWKKVKELEGLK